MQPNANPTETLTDEADTGAARVFYLFTVCGQRREFVAETTVSGSGAQAALDLIGASYADALDWLRAQAPMVPTRGLFEWMLGLRRASGVARCVEPVSDPECGYVAAVVEIDGVTHEYRGNVLTAGDPYRATSAALHSAKNDLWNWAWDQKTAARSGSARDSRPKDAGAAS